MTVTKTLIAAAALTLSLAACGGDGGRPSQAEIKDALTSEDSVSGVDMSDMDDAVADCMAEAFHDSDLSDEALRALVDGDEDYEGSEEDTEAMTDLSDEFMECATPAAE